MKSLIRKYRKKASFIFYLLAFGLLFYQSLQILDPDFGWRLTTGRLILEKGIPKTDPFSYTMPSFPFVDHAWLTDVFIALTYPLIGKIGLTFLFTFFAFLTFFLISGGSPLMTFISSSFVLGFMASARPQFVGWLIFALFMSRSWDHKFWEKYKKFTPLVFILWANLHGSFPVGLTVLLIRATFSFLEKRKLSDFYVFTGCLLATFVNPYGIGVWREILTTILDVSLRWRITEWYPFLMSSVNFLVLGFITLTGTLAFKYWRAINLEELAVVLFFFFQAMLSVRHLPIWLVVAFPFTSRLFLLFKKELFAQKIPLARKRFGKIKSLTITGSLGIIFLEVFISSLNPPLSYPDQAVIFLKQNLPESQIFSTYNWGGFLIWKLPEKKVFIDGRMPSWKTEKEMPGESQNAFADYQKILSGENVGSQFEKHGIDTALLPSYCFSEKKSLFLEKLLNFLRLDSKLGFGECGLYKKLEEMGWRKVYEDNVGVIYQKG